MKTKYILGMVLSAALLFTGCMKEDIDELRAQQAENASRIAALEAWQTTVNSNIASLQQLVTALEGNDYVTGVVAFANPTPGGYRITFSKSDEATIWNGAKGDQGDTGATGATGRTPAIGVAEFLTGSGVYYWTLDGVFIESNGNKMPVTGEDGQDGKTPKVAIGTDGYWYVSADGTASGTPPPGSDWVNTNVKATSNDGATGPAGPQGPKGDPGDAIFAANGVNNANADFVEFTLADNTTTIRVPKYKTIGISFTQPGAFNPSAPQVIDYTVIGGAYNEAPDNIIIAGLPEGWKSEIDTGAKTITITAPLRVTDGNYMGEAAVLVGQGDQTAMHKLSVRAALNFTGAAKNEVGAIYYRNGTPTGVVFWLDPSDSRHGKVVGLQENIGVQWALSSSTTDAINGANGRVNMNTIYNISSGTFSDYPAFAWVHSLNDAGQTYGDANATGVWYLPAKLELKAIYAGFSGWVYESIKGWNDYSPTPDHDEQAAEVARAAFNGILNLAGGTAFETITNSSYWSSSEFYPNNASLVRFHDALSAATSKKDQLRVRAVLAF